MSVVSTKDEKLKSTQVLNELFTAYCKDDTSTEEEEEEEQEQEHEEDEDTTLSAESSTIDDKTEQPILATNDIVAIKDIPRKLLVLYFLFNNL